MDPTCKVSRIDNQVSEEFEIEPRDEKSEQRTSVIENRVVDDAEEDGYNTDEGVRVTAEQADNSESIPIDPVTGKRLPPIIDPLTGRVIRAKVDRESTVRAILDEEEQAEDEYEEIIEEEIIAHQSRESYEQDDEPGPMPPIRHSRLPDEKSSTIAKILNRNRGNPMQSSNMVQFQEERQQFEEQNTQARPSPYSRFNGNAPNVPPGFFEAKVDNPVEDKIRSQFGPVPYRRPQQQQQPPPQSDFDHRNGFQDERQHYDQMRNQHFGLENPQQQFAPNQQQYAPDAQQLTPEQQAVLAKISNQPHRFGMEPNLPEQVAAKRQADIAQYAADQRNQLSQIAQNGVMPKVFSQRIEPAAQGFDLIDSGDSPVTISSPENSLFQLVRKGIREELSNWQKSNSSPLQSSQSAQQQPVFVQAQQPTFVPQQQPIYMQAPQQQPIYMQAPQHQPIYMQAPQQQPIYMQAPQQQPIYMQAPQQQPIYMQAPQQQPLYMPQQQPFYMQAPQQQPMVQFAMPPPQVIVMQSGQQGGQFSNWSPNVRYF